MIKKLFMGIGVCTLAFGLAACGGDDTDTTEEEGAAPEESETAEQDLGSAIDTESIPDVIATVNGEDINKEVYVGNLEQGAMQLTMQGIDIESEEGLAELELMKDQLLDRIINSTLISQAANEEGVEASEEEIDTGIEELIAQIGLESQEQLQELLDEQGVSTDELRADVAETVKSEKYLDQNISVDDISEEDLQAAYDELVAMVEAEGEETTEIPSFEEYKDQLENQMLMEQEQQQVGQLIETLRADSEITIHI
ncbi:SurA N-terminal domain-containing protein [Halalkalibacter kiskunsagensis]|uniref:SurA N-terminal domain-containing protein n=1 Tax=Halalkalibacter kiskunsagensis TaxID=1548599 RepID=A0ABV6KFU4_9BACI